MQRLEKLAEHLEALPDFFSITANPINLQRHFDMSINDVLNVFLPNNRNSHQTAKRIRAFLASRSDKAGA